MSQEEIVARIRELAKVNGGRLGMRVFFEETGVKEQWLRKQAWYPGWNQLIDSLGLETQAFGQPKVSHDHIVRSVAGLALRLGKWPTDDDFRREKSRDASFPGLKAIRPLKKSGALPALAVKLAAQESSFGPVADYASPHLKDVVAEPVDTQTERIRGYVYMMRSGRRFKIGKSLDPSRRHREIKLQLPEETLLVHSIPTDDPSGIEGYWHRRFAAKRIRNTEFFELDSDDVRAFRRRAYQ